MPIWLPTIKSRESPQFPCVQVVSDFISIKGLHTKLWAPKVTRVPTLEISRFRFGNFGKKWHLDVGPLAMHIVYYKGESGSFPEVKVMVSLVSSCYSWLIHAPKCSYYTLTNLLFGLCRSVWVIELFVNLPSPISELHRIPLPPKCYKRRSMPQLLFLPLFSPLDS